MTQHLSNKSSHCPKCKKSLIGKPIAKEHRAIYGNNTHYSLVIGIEYKAQYDGVTEWMCPFCYFTNKRKL